MRNCYVIPLFLLFATTIFAQQKTEFGLSARAGNFTLPKKGPGPQPAGFTHSNSTLSGGFSTGFGLYGQMNIKPRWGMTAELLYTISSFSAHENFNYDPQVEQYILIESDWARRYVEHSLVMPLKVHYNLGVSARTMLALGVAPSFNISTHQTISSATSLDPLYEGSFYGRRTFYSQDQNPAEPAPRLQMLLVASLHQRIGARMLLGIEVMGSPRPNDLSTHFLDNKSNISTERSPYFMKSISASLRYCIFR